jgi:hypothetical protein
MHVNRRARPIATASRNGRRRAKPPRGTLTGCPDGWDDAAERCSGSHVVFGTGAGAPTVFARSLA